MVQSNSFTESYLCFSKDVFISRELHRSGTFDFHKLELALSILGKTYENFIDIGANIGTTVIPAIKRKMFKRGYAAEPEPRNFRTLMANVYLNNLADKIQALPWAITNADHASLVFELSPDNMGDHRVTTGEGTNQDGFNESNRERVSVAGNTLDTFLNNFSEIDINKSFFWVDTQGHEGAVLQGAQLLKKTKPPMVMEFWPYGLRQSGTYEALKNNIFEIYDSFYDLDEKPCNRKALTAQSLDALFNSKTAPFDATDLLLV